MSTHHSSNWTERLEIYLFQQLYEDLANILNFPLKKKRKEEETFQKQVRVHGMEITSS